MKNHNTLKLGQIFISKFSKKKIDIFEMKENMDVVVGENIIMLHFCLHKQSNNIFSVLIYIVNKKKYKTLYPSDNFFLLTMSIYLRIVCRL